MTWAGWLIAATALVLLGVETGDLAPWTIGGGCFGVAVADLLSGGDTRGGNGYHLRRKTDAAE